MIAILAMESGIAPQHLLEAPEDLLDEMVDILAQRAEAAQKAQEEQTRERLRTDVLRRLGR